MAHPRCGRDILVRYDGKYSFETRLGVVTELTNEEVEYLRYPLDLTIPETLEKAEQEWERLKTMVRVDK